MELLDERKLALIENVIAKWKFTGLDPTEAIARIKMIIANVVKWDKGCFIKERTGGQ